MKGTDERLSKHIKTVFDDLDQVWTDRLVVPAASIDIGDPDHGWLELRKKYPEKNNRKVLYLWLSGLAASLLIIAGALFLNQASLPGDQSARLSSKKNSLHPKLASPSPIVEEHPFLGHNRKLPQENLRAAQSDQKHSIIIPPASRDIDAIEIPLPSNQLLQDSAVSVVSTHTADTTMIPVTKVAANQTQRQESDTYNFLREENKRLHQQNKSALPATAKSAKESTAKTLFDVYTATFLNYYGDNPSSVNAGGGFNANIRINKHIYLAVGAGISENNISYNDSSRPSALSGDLSSVVLSNGDIVPITGSKLEANFLNIDLPLAVKFYPGKSGRYYFSTGINSSTYLNQKYITSFNYYNQSASSYSSVKNKSEELEFNGFDFAGNAIFAVGINQRLSKNSILTFEPFFKPALKGIGEKNFRINTVGMSLKLGFGKKTTGN
jgi:hypothetical protein